jgi:hypothetical protein
MTTGTSLYYPNLFPDPEPLKVALLYWDRVRCLEHDEFHVQEMVPEIQQAIDAGAVAGTPIAPYAKRVIERFQKQVLPSYAQPGNEVSEDVAYEHNLKGGDRGGWDVPERRWFSREFREFAFNNGLARERDNKRSLVVDPYGQHFWLRPGLGNLYFSCLAGVIGEKIGSPPWTDDGDFAKRGEYFLFGQPATKPGAERKKQVVMVRLGVPLPTAESLKNVSMKKVLEFRRRREPERVQFRTTIEPILADICAAEDENQFENRLFDRRKQIARELADYRKALNEMHWTDLGGALAISCPSAITAGVATLAGAIPPWVGAVLTTFGLIGSAGKWWAERRKRNRETAQKCPWHYALTAVKEFA